MSKEAMTLVLARLQARTDTADLDAIAALNEALAEQPAHQEPVAWMFPDDLKRFETSEAYAEAYSIKMGSPTQGETVPLYTSPPAQRKPLTGKDIRAIGGVVAHDNVFFINLDQLNALVGIKENT